FDTDRLEEEKRRGLTIDLGFAPFALPSGRTASVVDVPGHERFLKNMLAGVGGMDVVLLVVAADDGVMPQTREHLDILRLLHVKQGIVVVTKRDLVDPELLELAQADIAEALRGTFLEHSPMLSVSAMTGEGMAALAAEIDRRVIDAPERDATAPLRLPIDRVFSKQGFGTVVTGTLWAGRAREGEEVELQPSGVKGRIRGLQVHGGKRTEVIAGQRVAINVAGLSHSDFERGEWLLAPGLFGGSTILDVWLELLPGTTPIAHRDRVRVHHGTSEAIGRVALLQADRLEPGQQGYAQLLLESPLVADFGDRFVVRRYSPSNTVGGGAVLHPRSRRLRRRHPGTLARLSAYREGRLVDAASAALRAAGTHPMSRASLELQVPFAARAAVWQELQESGSLYPLDQGFVHRDEVKALVDRLVAILEAFHRSQPHRLGAPREILQAEIHIPAGHLAQLLHDLALPEPVPGIGNESRLQWVGRLVALSGHRPHFAGASGLAAETLEKRAQVATLLDEAELLKDLPQPAREILADWVESGRLVNLGNGILAAPAVLDSLRARLQDAFEKQPQLTASQIREILGTSRKFLIPLLEYLDQTGFTRRSGDLRTLR
ncbi:MAG: selenocysteine-specific translation elongation factor, partial [Cyanobacteria bacterium REEB65]|nr:selenocysteine-specific translation elongation factor [Cyanobacteria bacterium REEB65]